MNENYLYINTRLSQGSVVGGFSSRIGGDDVPALARAAGFAEERLFTLAQVHGRRVIHVTAADSPLELNALEADALLTTDPGVALAVKTADCVPLLFCHHERGVVAAVHAGWRGLVADIIGVAVAELTRLTDGPASELSVAVGPAIGPCCFEVSREVAETIADAVGSRDVILERRPRPHIDLRGAVLHRLKGAGLVKEHIELVGPCTRCVAESFHSYRRDGPGKGRQLSFIYMKS